jgi:hypothetical protein
MGVGVDVGVVVELGLGKAVLVGSDRMETPPGPSFGLSPAEQVARNRATAASAATAPSRSIAMSSRFYRKGE